MTAAVTAFAIAAAALTVTLAAVAIAASTLGDRSLRALRKQGSAVKRTGGALLLGLGAWFGYLAVAAPTYLLP